MVNSLIIVTSGGTLDLYGNDSVALNMQIADVRDITQIQNAYSKTIVIPGTKENNIFFGSIFETSIADCTFNPNKKVKCQILANELPLWGNWYIQLKKIIKNQYNDLLSYEIVVYQDDFVFRKLNGLTLKDLDWTPLNYLHSLATVTSTWTGNTGAGLVFPLIDYGYGYSSSSIKNGVQYQDVRPYEFTPCLYLKDPIDRMFEYIGAEYDSSFLNTDYFKRACITLNSPVSFSGASSAYTPNANVVAFLTNDTVDVSSSNLYSTYYFLTSLITVPRLIRFDNDSTGGGQDPLNNYDAVSTFEYVFSTATNSSFFVNLNYKWAFNTAMGSGHNVRIDIKKNGNISALWSSAWQPLSTITGSGNLSIQTPVFPFAFGDVVQICYALQRPGVQPVIRLDFTLKGGSYFKTNLSGPQYSIYNFPVFMSDIIPDIPLIDLYKSTLQTFNLYTEPSKEYDNVVNIKPRDDYYSAGANHNWTKKLQKDLKIEEVVIPELVSKEIKFTFTEDSDYYSSDYQDRNINQKEDIYGSKVITVDNDFLAEDSITEIKPLWSAAPLANVPGYNNFIIPVIESFDQNNLPQPTTFNTKLLYFGGLVNLAGDYFVLRSSDASVNDWYYQYDYPYAGHLVNNPIFPTEDLNFGAPKFTYYNNFTNTYPTNNLYTRFHQNQTEEIIDPSARMFIGYFHLTVDDMLNLSLSDTIEVDREFYHINRIIDYNPSVDSFTKVELIKTKVLIKKEYLYKESKPFTAELSSVGKNHIIGRLNHVQDNFNFVIGHRVLINQGSGYNLVAGRNINLGNAASDNIITGINNSAYTNNTYIISGSGNTIVNNANGIFAGYDNIIDTYSTSASTGNNNNILFGIGNTISGYNISNTFILGGNNNTITGEPDIFNSAITLTDYTSLALINSSNNNLSVSQNATLINSSNITINTGVTNTVYIGVNTLTGDTNDTVYVSLLDAISGVTSPYYNGVPFSGLTLWTADTGNQSIKRNNSAGNLASSNCSSVFAGKANSGTSSYSSIVNGVNNYIQNYAYATILNGLHNKTNGKLNLIGGGNYNYTINSYATVLNGGYNSAIDSTATVINGFSNAVNKSSSLIGNGSRNTVGGKRSTILNGDYNNNSGDGCSIINGSYNTIAGARGCEIINGSYHILNGRNTSIINGYAHSGFSYCSYSTFINGSNNYINAPNSTIINGNRNKIYQYSYFGLIGNGSKNYIQYSNFGLISQGNSNYIIKNAYSSIINGQGNLISSSTLTAGNVILNGSQHRILNSSYSLISGGYGSMLSGVTNSAIIGMNFYSGFSSNTVYAPHLVLSSLTSNDVHQVYAEANGHLIIYGSNYEKVFAQSGLPIASTKTTAEEVLAAIRIPAGTLGNNDRIVVDTIWQISGRTSNVSLFIALNTGNTITGETKYQSLASIPSTLGSSAYIHAEIQNQNSSSLQHGVGNPQANWVGTNGNIIVNSSFSTSVDWYVLINSQKVTNTDPTTLLSYSIKIYKP